MNTTINQSRISEVPSLDTSEVTHVQPMRNTIPAKIVIPIVLVTAILGVVTGVMVARLSPKTSTTISGTDDATIEKVKTDKKEGVIDKSTFKDTATGVLNVGSMEGEGNFFLERGAKDQRAYLTSSIVDMNKYVGKKVQVWGQTMQAQKAGWLMDVGMIEAVQ